jgi:hypothetical protein
MQVPALRSRYGLRLWLTAAPGQPTQKHGLANHAMQRTRERVGWFIHGHRSRAADRWRSHTHRPICCSTNRIA